jgi:N-glycosylase/DNA lyase
MQTIKISDNAYIRTLKKEYLLKKSRIASRLNDFNKFYNENCSWFYDDKMELRPVNKNDDERIFEELCFCIFTANTSAEMGLKAVDATRELLVNGTQEEMTARLSGIYRFSNLRPQYILHTRNYLKNELNFKLKDKIEELRNDAEELRKFFAFNPGIKGLSYKEASHFLRNIGVNGYAILDKHIVNSLIEFNVIDKNIKLPLNAKTYPEVEKKMKIFSNEIEIPMDELDLLLWSRKNGRILK